MTSSDLNIHDSEFLSLSMGEKGEAGTTVRAILTDLWRVWECTGRLVDKGNFLGRAVGRSRSRGTSSPHIKISGSTLQSILI